MPTPLEDSLANIAVIDAPVRSEASGRWEGASVKDDDNKTDDLAHFDLTREIANSERQKPWPSGIHARTLDKRLDFRVVLISMESGARLKEHHVDGSTSVQVLKGHIRYSAHGRTHDLQTGSLVTLGASIRHEVESRDESVFLLTISWPGKQ